MFKHETTPFREGVMLGLKLTSNKNDNMQFKKKKTTEITANLNGCFKLQQIRLLQENLSGSGTEMADLRLRQLHLLARAAANFEKAVDYVVHKSLVHLFPSQKKHKVNVSVGCDYDDE